MLSEKEACEFINVSFILLYALHSLEMCILLLAIKFHACSHR
jgi:hypothetical protein